MSLKIGSQDTCKISKLVYKGTGLGQIGNIKIFVPGTVPQDEVKVRITKKKRNYLEGKAIEFVKNSPLRTNSICPNSGSCGGCQVLEVDYKKQLELKETIILDAIQYFLPEAKDKLLPIIPAPQNLFYRNKMEFSFGQDPNTAKIFSGLKVKGRFDQIIPLQKCFLFSEKSDIIRSFISDFLSKQPEISAWDYHKNTGFLRYLVMRHSKTFDRYLINIVVSEDRKELLQNLAGELNNNFPKIESILYSVKPEKADTAFSQEINILSGPGFLKETLGNKTFIISALSFFQTNTLQAETLYQTIAQTAALNSKETVMDLYCGTGTIGLFLAGKAKKIIGIEENPEAIKNAEKNSELNKVQNAIFYSGRVKNILKFNQFNPDVVITDPPRCGMVPKALQRMIDLKAKKVIYISCNPITLLRDLKTICQSGYKLVSLQPVDMFPNTFHIESIALVERTR
ncbi:23S rRNA (uracil(1939)-C(5))-methyltransferase RlmD [Candidatus Margulisiibacteriota bacterium]